MKVTGLQAGDARGIYKNTQLDLRIYRRLQMWVHAEALVDDPTNLKDGDLAIFIRLGSDVKNNYYEYEIPLSITPPKNYNNFNSADRAIVWPTSNRLDIPFDIFTDIKNDRNRERGIAGSGVGYTTLYTQLDPNNSHNTVSLLGNPSLSDVRVMLIGIRNKSNTTKDGTIWVNELKVTDFNEDGGWAFNGSANLSLSDVAMVNVGYHKETEGFGGVDQGLALRRLEDYELFNVAVQGDVGKLLPEKAKLTAPIYYSKSTETTTPKYNPLDQDILLKDALEAAATQHERDSIKGYAVTRKSTESFSISNMRFNVTSKVPMPWDPANFQLAFSFTKQKNMDPTTEYENTNDYRGSFQYSYSPVIKPLKPFANLKGENNFVKFLKEWQINWLFNNLTFFTSMSRHYYEQQTRSEVDVDFQLPVQVSKNFLWDRQFTINWNLLQSLQLSFASNTTARIEETLGAVNKRLFPDKYRDWKDTVMSSIKHLGTPWNYNQTFTGSYRLPFSKLAFLDFLSGSVTYNSTYRWDRGTTVDDLYLGNSIQNQSTWTAEARLNFEGFYNKIPYLKNVNSKFSSKGNKRGGGKGKNGKLKRYERVIHLNADTTTIVKHNLKTKNIKIGSTESNKFVKLKTNIIDENTVEILDKGEGRSVKIVIRELPEKEKKNIASELAAYAMRFVMMPRSVSFRWRNNHSLNLPLFSPNIGDIFGQSTNYGPMSPGLDFAFGFYDESYVNTALERGWLLTDGQQTSPAIWNKGEEFNFELSLEPLRGLKVVLTSNLTDNRTSQVQFMYSNMPTSFSGNYTRTHVAIASALRNSKASNGYASDAFDRFLEYIPVVSRRYEARYHGLRYPTGGFLANDPLAGAPYNPENGSVSKTSSDVLIPAFLAAYSGQNVNKITLKQFPGLSAMLPNWKVTYDGLTQLGNLKNIFKSFTITHAYQCTYSVGSYSSYLNWMGVDGDYGFTLDEQTGMPIPSSPYNISSVAITEKFAPLIGFNMTLKNDIQLNTEYRDSRTLNLNSSAGQVVETTSRQITIGAGYKIANFNTILKLGKKQGGVSNDLSLNLDFSFSDNQSLIRRIESAYTQATQGTQTWSINFMASYVVSKKITLNAFFDHQVNTPLVSNTAYPTTNSSYGVSINISLAR